MVIDQLNTLPSGGAGVAALRLHRTLRKQGIDSRFWCARIPAELADEGCFELCLTRPTASATQRVATWFQIAARRIRWQLDKWRFLAWRSKTLEMFSVPWLTRNTPFDSGVLSGEILHLHWVTRFLDIPTFFSTIPDTHPVVWTLHDMNAFTGGCHHSDGCMGFTSQCGNCPQLRQSGPNDLSHRALSVRLHAVQQKNLHIVTPSRWMERLVLQSRVFGPAQSVQTIYNGLDVDQFQPHDKAAAKRQLGLPPDRTVLAFGAASLGNRRKGWHEYVSAVSRLAANHPVVGLVFGGGDYPRGTHPNFPVVRVGYLHDAQQQSRIYSAADVFVLPSLGENLAQTGVESLACGTPVVAFDVGGLSEYVRPGETGQLATCGDVASLSRQIEWMIQNPVARQQMGIAGRELIQREFDHIRQAGKYARLYKSVIADAAEYRAA